MKYIFPLAFIALLTGCATVIESVEGDGALHSASGPDFVRAREFFKTAAAKGDAKSEAKYAAMCMSGLGGPVDTITAMENLRAADAQGSPMAAMLLADIYRRGDPSTGITPDLNRALEYARRAEPKAKAAARELVAQIQRQQQGLPPELVTRVAPRRSMTEDGPPQRIEVVTPVFPVPLQMLALHANVLVDFVVEADGRAAHARVVTPTLPQFDAAAIAAINTSKYLPGIRAGKPTAAHVQVPIGFAIDH